MQVVNELYSPKFINSLDSLHIGDMDYSLDFFISAEMPVNVLKFVYYASPGCFEKGTAYQGGNIASSTSTATSKGECQVNCQNHAQCHFWTFYTNNDCFLKEDPQTVTHFQSSPNPVSGPKWCAWNVSASSAGNVHDLLNRCSNSN